MSEPQTKESLNARFKAFRESPEYRRALAEDDEARDFPFLGLSETVCGIELRPMTMLDMTALYHLRSPFLSVRFRDGSRKPIPLAPNMDLSDAFWSEHILVTNGAIAQFLWSQSVAFMPKEGNGWNQFKAERRRKAFVRRFCRPLKYGEACEGIRKFINDTMADKPIGSSKGGSQSPASWMASEVYFLCQHYPWSECEVLNMPLRRVFQYERAVLAANGKSEALASRADKLRSDWLKAQRAQRN